MLGDSLGANVRVRVGSGLHQRQGGSASSDARADENGACRFDDLFNLVVSPAFLVIAWAHVGAIGVRGQLGWTV
jgi:hypothetical protein